MKTLYLPHIKISDMVCGEMFRQKKNKTKQTQNENNNNKNTHRETVHGECLAGKVGGGDGERGEVIQ